MINKEVEFDLPKGKSSIIKVIGVGGGGNNALKHMYERGIHGVDFVICNTDQQTLDNNPVANKVQLGISTTEGLGAGADPEVGEKAAIESIDDIKAALGQNTKMVFITAGMGGGTGTGAAPVVAKIAKEMGILTVGIVTVPFSFEGKRRLEQAEAGLDKLRANVDSLIVINNDKLRHQFGNLGFKQGFAKADEVLTNAAKGMAEVITAPFAINIDFRDAKSVLQNSGTALMSTGIANGEKRAEEAVKKALDSPLLNDNKITGAKDVLLLILSGSDEKYEATMDEIGIINDYVQAEAGGNNAANIIFGVGTDEELGDAIKVLVIATGFAKENDKVINVGDSGKKVVSLMENEATIRRESPFKMREEREPSVSSEKNVITLDEEEYTPPVFQVEEEGRGEDIVPQDFSLDNEQFDNEPEFITYEEDDTEAVSFVFDVEEDIKTPFGGHISEEKPSLFSIRQEEVEPKIEVKTNDFQVKSQQTDEISQENLENTEKKSGSPFRIREDLDPRVQERRNKLQDFNAYYQSTEVENEFETIPAFRRRSINLGMQNDTE